MRGKVFNSLAFWRARGLITILRCWAGSRASWWSMELRGDFTPCELSEKESGNNICKRTLEGPVTAGAATLWGREGGKLGKWIEPLTWSLRVFSETICSYTVKTSFLAAPLSRWLWFRVPQSSVVAFCSPRNRLGAVTLFVGETAGFWILFACFRSWGRQFKAVSPVQGRVKKGRRIKQHTNRVMGRKWMSGLFGESHETGISVRLLLSAGWGVIRQISTCNFEMWEFTPCCSVISKTITRAPRACWQRSFPSSALPALEVTSLHQ